MQSSIFSGCSVKTYGKNTRRFARNIGKQVEGKPAGVVSPKLSRILLEKSAVSPPPAWIKKFEPIVTQDPMTIRKYL
ncbi:hypothetical protein AVEN_152041-1, partial [Araneus ventricosus]